MIRLLLHATDFKVAEAMRYLLRRAGDFDVLPLCANAEELRQTMAAGAPDVALLEVGEEVRFATLARLQQDSKARVVLWVKSISPELSLHAMEMGVRGILRHGLPAEVQLRCLRLVHAGHSWFERSVMAPMVPPPSAAVMSREEQMMVRLLAHGLKNAEIGERLELTEAQVMYSLKRLFRKLAVKDRFELALYGLKYLPPVEESRGSGRPAGDLEVIA